MQAECGWFSGANENMVWEGMHDVAQLEAGVVTIHITVADVDGSTHPSQLLRGDRWAAVGAGGADVAERNIDAVMLNPNTTDIELRLRPGGFCPESWALCFDSLLSQAGEVFARLTSMSSQALSVILPRAQKRDGFQFGWEFCPAWQNTSVYNTTTKKHSYEWQMGDACTCPTAGSATPLPPSPPRPGKPAAQPPPGCPSVTLQPGATSDWIEIGSMLPTLDHSTLNVPAGNYSLQIGVKDFTSGSIAPIGRAFAASPEPALSCASGHNNPKAPGCGWPLDISALGACSNDEVVLGASVRDSRTVYNPLDHS